MAGLQRTAVAGAAVIQASARPRLLHLGVCALGAAVVAAPALAQEQTGRSGALALSTSLDAELNYVDTQHASGNDTRDVATQIRPGLQITSRSGRVQGSLAYTGALIHHTDSTQSPELQNNLNARMNADVVPGWAFVDASATVGQRAVSPFGRQFVQGDVQDNDNREEQGTVSITPHVRGAFGRLATYDAALNASASNTRHSIVGDSTSAGGSLSVNSSSGGLVGWGLQGSSQKSKFRGSRSTVNDRATASLSVRPDPELLLTLRGGQESTNAASIDKRSYNNWGAGGRWTPTERTVASIDTDRRYFGNSWNVTFEHRFPLSSFRFTSLRDVANGGNPNGVGQPVTLYQQFFAQFASIQPDPVLREQFVLDFLRALGQDPNSTAPGGFINSAVSLQRRSDLVWTYTGRRLTLSLQAYESQTSVIDENAPQALDGNISQWGYTTTVSYRLTPTASATVSGSRLITSANSTQPGNELKSLTASITDRIGLRTTASLSARYSVFNGFDGYRESSISASLSHRF